MPAPIRKRNRGKKRWMLDLRYLGGRREFFATREEAEGARERALQEHKEQGEAAFALTLDERAELARLKTRLDAIGSNFEEAVSFFEKHKTKICEIKLVDAIEEILALKRATNKRDRSISSLGYTLQQLARSVGLDRLVASIEQTEIEDWLFKNGWKPATIKSKRIDLNTFFNAAVARKWRGDNPVQKIETVSLDDTEPGILSVEECLAILEAARKLDTRFVGCIALQLFAGIRPAELLRLDPEKINLDDGYVEVTGKKAKTRQRRLVQLSANAVAWIKIGCELPPKNFRARLNAIRVPSGFQGFRKRMENGKEKWIKVEGKAWPHDAFRHSFASYYLAEHGGADQTATEMGHRSTAMLFRHYRQLVSKTDAKKFWNLFPG